MQPQLNLGVPFDSDIQLPQRVDVQRQIVHHQQPQMRLAVPTADTALQRGQIHPDSLVLPQQRVALGSSGEVSIPQAQWQQQQVQRAQWSQVRQAPSLILSAADQLAQSLPRAQWADQRLSSVGHPLQRSAAVGLQSPGAQLQPPLSLAQHSAAVGIQSRPDLFRQSHSAAQLGQLDRFDQLDQFDQSDSDDLMDD